MRGYIFLLARLARKKKDINFSDWNEHHRYVLVNL